MAISYAATPSAANLFDFADEIVINEIMYQARPKRSDARHFADASNDNARRGSMPRPSGFIILIQGISASRRIGIRHFTCLERIVTSTD